VSKAEAALFAERLDDPACMVSAMGNGIDSTLFDPASVTAEPRMAGGEGPRLVFTGQMDYAPNIAAVERAIDRILPLIRAGCPGACLHVVGRNPPPALLARHGRDGVHVWGRVDDIRPWLAAADLALVPLEIARGVQNKVLEAMAMGLPVIATDVAGNRGLVRPGQNGLLCPPDRPQTLAAAILRLTQDNSLYRQFSAGALVTSREYTIENAAARHLELYASLLRRRVPQKD